MARMTLLVICALLVWFGLNIIRLERYNYAAALSMCDAHRPDRIKIDLCLASTETRTNPLWHLAYGLKVLDDQVVNDGALSLLAPQGIDERVSATDRRFSRRVRNPTQRVALQSSPNEMC